MPRLDHIWVVTAPRRHSGIEDIVFKVTPVQLINQVRGGLTEEDEPLFFDNLAEAEAEGKRRLDAYRAYRRVLDAKGDPK